MTENQKFVNYGTILRNVATVLRFSKVVVYMTKEGFVDITDTEYKKQKTETEKKICTIEQSYEALMGFATLLLPQLALREKIQIIFECHCPEYTPGHFVWDHKDFYEKFPYISSEQVERMKKIITFEHIE